MCEGCFFLTVTLSQLSHSFIAVPNLSPLSLPSQY